MIYFPKDWVNLEKQIPVLIVGSGAAGLSIALKLEKLGIPSTIVEGGELDYTYDSQEIYQGEIESKHKLPYGLDGSRLRYLGGSTNCWARLCGELDEEDFLPREWIPLSGWPIRKKDLSKYYDEAGLFFHVDRNKIKKPENHADFLSLPGFENRTLHHAENGFIWPSFNEHLKKSSLISVYLNANCTKLNANSVNRSIINSISIRSFNGHEKRIKSRNIILCCGGIENARILLNASVSPSPAIINEHDLIGRYYSDHPVAPCATIIGPKGKVFESKLKWASRGNLNLPFYKVPFNIQEKLKISNSVLSFYEQEDELTEGDLAAIKLLSILKGRKDHKFEKSDLVKIIKNPFGIFKIYLQRKKRLEQNKGSRMAMRFQLEQTPNRESRVYLSNEIDKFGLRKIKLNWVFNKIERRTADLLMAYAANALQVRQIGTLKMDQQLYNFNERLPLDLRGGHHHCGTTRMAKDPNKGVVDENLKVFGTKNLFVCGSSIFPTNSWVNPTFTIVAFSYRLADYISKELG